MIKIDLTAKGGGYNKLPNFSEFPRDTWEEVSDIRNNVVVGTYLVSPIMNVTIEKVIYKPTEDDRKISIVIRNIEGTHEQVFSVYLYTNEGHKNGMAHHTLHTLARNGGLTIPTNTRHLDFDEQDLVGLTVPIQLKTREYQGIIRLDWIVDVVKLDDKDVNEEQTNDELF